MSFTGTSHQDKREALFQSERIPPMKVLGSGQFPVNCAWEKSKPGFCRQKGNGSIRMTDPDRKTRCCYQLEDSSELGGVDLSPCCRPCGPAFRIRIASRDHRFLRKLPPEGAALCLSSSAYSLYPAALWNRRSAPFYGTQIDRPWAQQKTRERKRIGETEQWGWMTGEVNDFITICQQPRPFDAQCKRDRTAGGYHHSLVLVRWRQRTRRRTPTALVVEKERWRRDWWGVACLLRLPPNSGGE